jgi:hypothetical protein
MTKEMISLEKEKLKLATEQQKAVNAAMEPEEFNYDMDRMESVR